MFNSSKKYLCITAEEEIEDDGPVDNSGESEDGPPKVCSIGITYSYLYIIQTMI